MDSTLISIIFFPFFLVTKGLSYQFLYCECCAKVSVKYPSALGLRFSSCSRLSSGKLEMRFGILVLKIARKYLLQHLVYFYAPSFTLMYSHQNVCETLSQLTFYYVALTLRHCISLLVLLWQNTRVCGLKNRNTLPHTSEG